MFLNATTMDFAFKIILLFLSMQVPCYIANLEQSGRSFETRIDVNKINMLQHQWTADRNYFDNLSESEIRVRMGSQINPKEKLPKPWKLGRGRSQKTIPKDFDARAQWPDCYVISNVKDQANCGACWAVATASAYSDRRCITHKQKTNLEFSSEDLLTCCHECIPSSNNGDGCLGGYVPLAWDFIQDVGVVTGGDYGSRNTCKPYSTQPCKSSLTKSCPNVPAQQCEFKCSNEDYKVKYKIDKKHGGFTYSLTDERSAKLDLLEHGPFVALMVTCFDFMFYKKGVYFHVFGPCDNVYHAVKVIGWGQQDGMDYWLAVNTWNSSWGDNGLFKIDKTNNKVDFGYFTAGKVGPLH